MANQNKTKFEKRAKIPATVVNISLVTVDCFPFDVIVFAMLSAHGIWRETVAWLDVMWARCSAKTPAKYITNSVISLRKLYLHQ